MDEKKIKLRTGITTSYAEVGDPRGEPVLFLHGYTDTRLSFLGTIAHLARRRPDLRLIVCDLRGHGRSSLPAPDAYRHAPERGFRLSDFAGDALALLDELGIGRAHIVGHSLGSFIAQELALVAPGRVGRLVLIGSAAKIAGNPAIQELVLAQLLESQWRDVIESRGLAFPRDAYELTPRSERRGVAARQLAGGAPGRSRAARADRRGCRKLADRHVARRRAHGARDRQPRAAPRVVRADARPVGDAGRNLP